MSPSGSAFYNFRTKAFFMQWEYPDLYE